MTAVEHEFHDTDFHPIDMVETLAEQCSWDFDRLAEDRIAMAVEGSWRTYSLSLALSTRGDMLRLICTFEINPPAERIDEFLKLINIANDRIWTGNFTWWEEKGLLVFRYGLTLAGGAVATTEQVEEMVLNAVSLSERFYPAFQLVGWSSESAEEAAGIAIEQAYGTA